MSFQGDLGGMGLADLLQSLARGRAGVLQLDAKRGRKATLGLEGGLLHLLPDPDEDPEVWRRVARCAWADASETLVDALRMEEVARARRTENLYSLLDADSVHFKFAPGNVPRKPQGSGIRADESGIATEGPGREAVWCAPVSSEGFLLEYARLKDESASLPAHWADSADTVLQRLDAGPAHGASERFHRECDGRSSLLEISDRLGWPLRQTRNVALEELRRGGVRFSSPEELMFLAHHELAEGRVERTAGRLRSWLVHAPGGPLAEVDAHSLEDAWEGERLQSVLAALGPRLARRLLRRLDHALMTPLPSLAHWNWCARQMPDDLAVTVRLLRWQLRASADPSVPSVRDLITLTRALQAAGRRAGGAAVARIAAARAPDSAAVRLDVGRCLLDAGLASEAGPMLLEALRPMAAAGRWEEVLPIARLLAEACPADREARRMFARARSKVVQRKLVRKHSLVSMAVLAALSAGAFVQYRSYRAVEHSIEQITALSPDPRAALTALDQAYPEEMPPQIAALREELVQRRRAAEASVRTSWMDAYKAAAVECTVGDLELGLRRALELPAAPGAAAGDDPLPLPSDLFNGLAARLEAQINALGEKIEDTPEQIQSEQRQVEQLARLEAVAADGKGDAAKTFTQRITSLRKRLVERDERRGVERARRLERENLANQDLLINTARAHEKAGDHARALETYRKLLATDTTGKLAGLFEHEIAEVEGRCRAITDARRLAEAGQHPEAYATLQASLPDPDAWMLPWKVQSVPPGARARLADGTERVTPFVLESTWNEPVDLTLHLAGHESRTIHVEHPSDQVVVLSRDPERAWGTDGRVEAAPVSVESDHIVCDRSGAIARLTRGGRVVWQVKLGSLGGIGRSPVFLPRRPGHLLALTEDGEAWIVDAATGELQGPWNCEAPPLEGPVVDHDGAVVRLKNGKVLVWTENLAPEPGDEGAILPAPGQNGAPTGAGTDAGLAILRRRTSSATNLTSPWTPYTIDIGAETYTIERRDDPKSRVTVRRRGEWTYVAWEAPNVSIPRGRVWISDSQGLRAYAP